MGVRSIVLTGSSGFLGRHLLDLLKKDYRIFCIARRSQTQCGAPVHDNIVWFQTDIADPEALSSTFSRISDAGGADVVIHLAAHYDFSGDEHPEYWRTNVEGLRYVLDESVALNVRRFVFASSVAACSFPAGGEAIDETSVPDGDHIYAVTKRVGEEMLGEYSDRIQSCVVRFAALFSDWCEYPPLYQFLETWLSGEWNARILGGRGESAIPYLHVRDAAVMLRTLVRKIDLPLQGEVLVCSVDGATTHNELYEWATLSYSGERRRPIHLPAPLCRLGVWGRDLLGRMLGKRPFERPWMVRYIDKKLRVNASRTRKRLGWAPRARLEIERRMPFLIEHMKTRPVEWCRRNRAAMKKIDLRPNLVIYRLLEANHREVRRRFGALMRSERAAELFPSYVGRPVETLNWRQNVAMLHLMNSIRTGDRGLFRRYCHDLAEHRMSQGVSHGELVAVLNLFEEVCLSVLNEQEEGEGLQPRDLHDQVAMTFQYGLDEIAEVYERLE